MNASEAHAVSLAQFQVEQALGDAGKFKWNGKFRDLIPGTASCKKGIDIGGFKVDSLLYFTCLADQFLPLTPAQVKDSMLESEMDYNGDTWIIRIVDIPAGAKQLDIQAHGVV